MPFFEGMEITGHISRKSRSLVSGMVIVLFTALSFLSGCDKPDVVVESGTLNFSTDTVQFDTIFTTFESPTERLVVRNYTKNNIRIGRVFLQSGNASEFDMIVDGIQANDVRDLVLAKNDSLIIFIEMKSIAQDMFAQDFIVFEVGGQQQKVPVMAFVLDAIFYQDTVLANSYTVFNSSKPIVVDGALIVPENATLEIQAGTEIHFTPKRSPETFTFLSRIEVYGTLIVNGSKGNEVVFTNTRFGGDWQERAGQWYGLIFRKTSLNNSIQHALIKNGTLGIEADSMSLNSNPKVTVKKTQIRNMSSYGVLGLGYHSPATSDGILMENSLVHNCGEADVAILYGGNYTFRNCTFANYSQDFNRTTPLAFINNYDEFNAVAFVTNTSFTNCILWGSEEEEVALDSAAVAGAYNVTFNNCLVKSTLSLKGSGNVKNQDPQFVEPQGPDDPGERNYHLNASSPAINAGQNLSIFFTDDLENVPRDASFDIGCYEFQ